MTARQGGMREIYPVESNDFQYRSEEEEGRFTFSLEGDSEEASPSVALEVEATGAGEGVCRTESGRSYPFAWAWVGSELHLWLDGALYVFQRPQPRRRGSTSATDASGDIMAPMPGAVLDVRVSEGERVERNQVVMIMESMKMELVITAPISGVVRRVAAQPGQQVERGMRLLEIAPSDAPGQL